MVLSFADFIRIFIVIITENINAQYCGINTTQRHLSFVA